MNISAPARKPLPKFNPTVPAGLNPITYTLRKLEYTATCSMTPHGTIVTTKSYGGKEILIADNWVQDLQNGRAGKEGSSVVGAGGYKVAIWVCTNVSNLPKLTISYITGLDWR